MSAGSQERVAGCVPGAGAPRLLPPSERACWPNEMGQNSLLLINDRDLQRLFAMRPLEFQIFMVIAMASVQRFIRG